MDAPQSPYRKGDWTVTMLKEELKQRNLTLAGKKAELIERLEVDDVKRSSPLPAKSRPLDHLSNNHHQNQSPLQNRSATPRQSLGGDDSAVLGKFTVSQLQSELRKRGLSPVGKKEELVARLSFAGGEIISNQVPEELTPKVAKPKSPLKPFGRPATAKGKANDKLAVVSQFTAAAYQSAREVLSTVSAVQAISFGAASLFLLTLFLLNGPHQEHLTPIKIYACWYAKWFALGVLSTIGLGMGTFVLFLGPFVARCATAAAQCRSCSFPVFGPRAFQCQGTGVSVGPVAVLNKVKWEVLVWGVGTAVGHLPSFMLSRYAGQMRAAPLLDRLKRMSAFIGGGWLFFLLASTPNPLFDFSVIAAGYHDVMSMGRFWTLTLVGRAIVKAAGEAMIVILLFSKPHVDRLMALIDGALPGDIAAVVKRAVLAQRSVFQKPVVSPLAGLLAFAWRSCSFALVCYLAAKVVVFVAKEHRN